MKMTKKVLGVVIALAMLVNVFAMFSFAVAPDSAVDLTMRVDKEAYKAGDIVTITVSVKTEAEVGNIRIGGTQAIGYNSAVINPLDTSDNITKHGFEAYQEGVDLGNSGVKFDHLDMGDPIDEGTDWDSVYGISVTDDGEANFDATPGVDMFSFQMKLADDVADGDYVIGFNEGSYWNYNAIITDMAMGGVAGTDNNYYSTTNDYSFGRATIHVGEAVVDSSIVKFGGNQIRFNGIGADGNGVYDKTFDIRTVATIDEADFFALFGADNAADADAAAIANITAVGFVYTTGEYNEADAKAAAGTGASGAYVDAQVKYIQHTDGAYRFTCLTKGIGEADKDQSMTVLGYIKVGDNVAFFDAAQLVDFTEVYNNGLANLKAVNPGFNPEA